MKHKNTKAMILLLLSCTLIVSVFFVSRKKPQNIAVNQTIAVTKHSSSDETATEAATDKEEPSVEPASKKVVGGRTYIDGILIVNKHYSLPSDYNPGVDQTADAAIQKMIAAAHKDGITLWVRSGFRSYDIQTSLYNTYVAEDGKSAASRYSARPGHSEHQTGLAFDLNSLDQSFGKTPEGKWIAKNCWKYGFIIRYPKAKEDVTGYMYEPWHVRYLGKEVAKKVTESGLCLEEYLRIG